jgi:integrase
MRVVNESPIQNRAARARLSNKQHPYYRAVEANLHLGYRPGRDKGPGTWVARHYLGGGKYVHEELGVADDRSNINGAIDFHAAAAKAREWLKSRIALAQSTGEPAPAGPYLVQHAYADYVADYIGRGGKGLRTIEAAFRTHILPQFARVAVADLTTLKLKRWHQGVAASAPKLRTGKHAKTINQGVIPDTLDKQRARRSSANGTRSIFFAALNLAFSEGKVPSDSAWRRVRPFRGVDAARIRYLSVEECVRLVNACPVDLRHLVKAGLLTGARYSELTRLVASDFNPDAGTVLIQISKSGKPRHITLTDEARAYFTDLATGRPSHTLIFTRSNGSAWRPSDQSRPMRAACKVAKITPPISFHILRHCHGSLLALAGAPLQVIAAQLGHADSRISEKHYSHLSPSYVADTVRKSLPTFGIVAASTVKPLRRRKA